ncbi:MAG: serine hydrolase domain-containing protein [Thermonemataceae bacterium]
MNKIIPFLFLVIFFSCREQDSELNKKIRLFDNTEISSTDLTDFLKEQIDSLGIPGISIAIINEGKLVYSENIGYANLDTRKALDENSIFEAASLSKPVFAYMVMKLSERGAIELARPLYYYLPDSLMEVDQRYKNVNAIHVLSHSTGFPNWRWFDTPPDSLEIDRGTFYMIDNPGNSFTYSGEGYDYLARVIASNTEHKMSELDNLFKKLVQKPLGIEHMYFTWDEYLYEHKVYGHIDGKVNNRNWGSGLPYQNSYKFSPSGGLHTNAENYAKFLIAVMNGKGLLPETSKEMLKPRTVVKRSHNRYKEDGNTHWSLGFAITPLKNDTLYNHGGTHSDFQSQTAFSKNSKFGYVFFVNTKKGDELNKTLKEFLRIRK